MPIYLHMVINLGLNQRNRLNFHINATSTPATLLGRWLYKEDTLKNGRASNNYLLMLSRVSSSLNNLAKPKISSLETPAPLLTWSRIKKAISKSGKA